MKILIVSSVCLLLAGMVFSQDKKEKKQPAFGIKAGINFANVTNASSINSSNQSGFMVGVFMAPSSKSIVSYRTELLYSKQGYNYSTNTNTGNVNLDYIVLPQLMGINITKFVQLQLGAQMAYLLNAKVDSTNSNGSTSNGNIMDYYNRFDYGAAVGAEIYPIKNLVIGARYNISFGNLYKDYSDPSSNPSFIPEVDVKNNLIQIYAGIRF